MDSQSNVNIDSRVEMLTDLTADTRAQLRDMNNSISQLNLSFLLLCGAMVLGLGATLIKEIK